MSVIYNQTTINQRLQVVINNIDAGVGVGVLQLGTAGLGTILSSVNLLKPSGTVSGGVLTFNGTPLVDPLIAVSGVLASARVIDSNGTVVISGLTVGISSAFDIVTATTLISSGQTLALTSATITGN